MSDIAAILNCYTPASGANRAQVIVRTGGAVEIHGDDALARHVLRQLAATNLAPAPLAPVRDLPVVIPRRRGRPRKIPLLAALAQQPAAA